MGKIIFSVIAVVVLLGAGYWYFSQSSAPVSGTAQNDYSTTTSTLPPGEMGATLDDSITPTTTTAAPASTPAATNNTNPAKIMHATLHTSMGDITVEFLPQYAPNAVANFIKLAQASFYDATKFHRVIKGFMDQGGDPLTKDDSKMAQWGTGGPGYRFNDEISPSATNVAGTMAMANSGPNTNGSQFFINAVDNHFLDGKYTVFAKVTAGMDVVTVINNTPTDSSDRPTTPVVLKSITLAQ